MMIRFCIINVLLGFATLHAAPSKELPVEPITPPALQQTIADSDAPLLMVHAWATWCGPCREEFPELLEVAEAYREKGLVLLLVSADDPDEAEAVVQFLNEMNSPVGSRIITELSHDFINTLSPEWRGALPATFFFRNGERLEEWEGKRSRAQYTETIERLMKTKGAQE